YNVNAALSAAAFGSGGYGANAFGGTRAPDFQAALRVDQAWGLFQLSVAAHNNHVAYYSAPATPSEINGHPDDEGAWAIEVALSTKNIPTGRGDTINLQAVYTDVATRYNFQSLAPQNFAMFSGTSLPGAYQSVGLAGAADAVFGNGSSLSTVKT